jgi:myo-inositol-1(or 4)-monophosphatase
VRLAHGAAEIQLDGLRSGFEIDRKSAAGDLVTEIDRAAEHAIVEGIRDARRDDAILGEEGTDRAGTSGVRWVLDPLDGTASYVRGYPGFGVSIGVEVDDRPSVGVVIDALGRTTVGLADRGAERDGVPARPAARTALADSIVATGFGYDTGMRVREAETLGRLIDRIADIRRSGSAAMDLCAVACGEVDAYFDQPDGEVLTVAVPKQLLEPLLRVLGDAGLTV